MGWVWIFSGTAHYAENTLDNAEIFNKNKLCIWAFPDYFHLFGMLCILINYVMFNKIIQPLFHRLVDFLFMHGQFKVLVRDRFPLHDLMHHARHRSHLMLAKGICSLKMTS